MSRANMPMVEQTALLHGVAASRFRNTIDVVERFFHDDQAKIVTACAQCADRFRAGGRLFVFGTGASASDAQHVSVEFVHPVIVGKRALPALALTTDTGAITGTRQSDVMFADQLAVLARPGDIALGISATCSDDPTIRALRSAKALGILTIAIQPEQSRPTNNTSVDLVFTVPSKDPMIVQEVQETFYHVLWELVHVFLDHGESNA